jgi:DNA gyrase subunit B
MENDYSADIEKLKKEMDELKSLFMQFIGKSAGEDSRKESEPLKNVHPMKNMHPDPKLSSIMDSLCEITDKENRTGSITYLGVFTSGGRQSNWIQNSLDTDGLLALIENKSAATVLQCIGNNDRLTLLLALLRTPMTVASIVEKCGFNTTGQVYHHLKPLIAADLVFEVDQAERGVYAVKPHRVQGIIMLLAGISDLIDTRYSQGSWAEEQKEN